MKIAEVESRFHEQTSVEDFVKIVKKCGFELKLKNTEKNYFVFMDFKKTEGGKRKIQDIKLKSCYYKKR